MEFACKSFLTSALITALISSKNFFFWLIDDLLGMVLRLWMVILWSTPSISESSHAKTAVLLLKRKISFVTQVYHLIELMQNIFIVGSSEVGI